MSAHHDLLASCWTWAGDVGPGDEDQRSPVPLWERIEALAASGWRGAGIQHADLVEFRDTIGLPRLREQLESAGIERIELEFLRDWWARGAAREASDRQLDDFLDAAAQLGAPALKIGASRIGAPGSEAPEPEAFAADLHRIAERADAFGVTLALEAMADTNLPTFGAAVDLIRAVGHPRAGLAVDIYQLARSGDDDFTPLPALLEGVPVAVVELGDAPVDADGVGPRCLPGRGDLDMAGFVVAMIDAGWTGFWGVEIIADELRALPVAQGLSEVRAGVDVALARAQETLEARS